MLLCLMRLRLGLTLQDLSNRFKVSLSTASSVLKGLCTILRALIFITDKESLVNTKLQRFKNITQTFIILLVQVRYSLRHHKILKISRKTGQNNFLKIQN